MRHHYSANARIIALDNSLQKLTGQQKRYDKMDPKGLNKQKY